MAFTVPVNYLTPPATIVNQALDRIGASDKIIGDITDGSPVGEAARRNYGQLLRQLLRTAHWGFARKNGKLTLLGDSSGQSPAPVKSVVEEGWQYAYAWPTDAVLGRWMPFMPPSGQPNNSNGVPLTTGQPLITPYPQMPGRFLVTSSDQYPIEVGQLSWDQMPDLQRTEGVGPIYRKIILTNCCEAHFVYTRLVTVIEEWDNLFREAMVALMALSLCPVAIDDKKERIAQRNLMIPIAKNIIADARLASADESGYPQSTDHQPVWISGRNGGWWNGLGTGNGAYSGYTFYPWDASMQWCGSVY